MFGRVAGGTLLKYNQRNRNVIIALLNIVCAIYG